MNRAHAQRARALQVQLPVVNEDALLGSALRHLQRNTIDGFIRFSDAEKTGAEKSGEVFAETELLNAIEIQLQRLVVDRGQEVALRARQLLQDGPRIRVSAGLGKHEFPELLGGKRAGTIEDGLLQVLVERDLSGFMRRTGQLVPVLEILPVEVELPGGLLASG